MSLGTEPAPFVPWLVENRNKLRWAWNEKCWNEFLKSRAGIQICAFMTSVIALNVYINWKMKWILCEIVVTNLRGITQLAVILVLSWSSVVLQRNAPWGNVQREFDEMRWKCKCWWNLRWQEWRKIVSKQSICDASLVSIIVRDGR